MRAVVGSHSALRAFFSAANAVLAVPRCRNLLLRTRLLLAYALPHVDYALRLVAFLEKRSQRSLRIAVGKVLRRALLLHPRASADLICAAARWLPMDVRAGQLGVAPDSSRCAGPLWTARARDVAALRGLGAASSAAAWHVFNGACTAQPQRTYALRCMLLCSGDAYARTFAFNISMPTALNL